MEKEFVPYEQALALKELGFDEPCFGYYTGDKKHLLIRPNMGRRNEDLNDIVCTAPLYQQVFRWFRGEHSCYHYIEPIYLDGKVSYEYCVVNSFKDEKEFNEGSIATTFEEAELECLKELIEITKTK